MAYNEQMASKFNQALLSVSDVREKKLFGSLGFMINGKLALCVRSDDVMYKLPPELSTRLIIEGVAEAVNMGDRHMKNWIFIPNDKLAQQKDFLYYLNEAIYYTVASPSSDTVY